MSRARGFSLLEVLVAVALFALAMGLAYGGLDAVVRGRAQLEAEAVRLAALQQTVGLLERDLRAALPRGARAGDLRRLPALLLEGDTLELTRSGLGNRLAAPRAEIERLRWAADEGALVRYRFAVLDRNGSEVPAEDRRLEGVRAWRVEALTEGGRWTRRWPEPGSAPDDLPRALRIAFSVDGLGDIERLLELASVAAP